MDNRRIAYAVAGFSSFVFCVFNLKRWLHQKKVTTEKLRLTSEALEHVNQERVQKTEKLRLISEALEHAEERVQRFQERHDRILSQISAYYLVNKELEEALAAARDALKEAMDFAVNLRTVQIDIINSIFP